MPFGFWEIKRKGSLPKARIIMSRVAGLFLGIDFTAWNYSIFYVGAGIAAILLNLQVIVVPMLSAIFDKWLGKKQKTGDVGNPEDTIEDELVREGLAPGHSPDEAEPIRD